VRLFRTSANSIKQTHPILFNMYDESDPGHTFGCSEYFIEQLEEMLEEAETEKDRETILKEIEFVSKYEDIEIY